MTFYITKWGTLAHDSCGSSFGISPSGNIRCSCGYTLKKVDIELLSLKNPYIWTDQDRVKLNDVIQK